MYITRDSISCLKAFLDGWFLRSPNDVVDDEIMTKFQERIETKYKVKTSHSWCDVLLFHSQDESHALQLFFKEFDEFRESLKKLRLVF